MSTTATSIDLKSFLTDFIQKQAETLLKDMRHLTDEQLSTPPMGCARPVLEFVAECAGFNRGLARTTLGEQFELPSQAEREQFYRSIDTREKATHLLQDSVVALVDAIKSVSDEDLNKEVMAYWGEPITLYRFIHTAGVHMAYHDGQVNYLQCLHGDGAVHWLED